MNESWPKPILYVHHRPELGGAPQSLYYLLRELDRDRFEPHVYCPPGPAADLFHEARATVHTGPVAGFTHIWASVYSGRRWLLLGRELSQLPGHLLQFRETLRSRPFSLVHLNDSPLVPAAWMAQKRGIPVVWHLRSALPDNGDSFRSSALRAAIARLSAASIAINRDIAEVFGVASEVVPNTVDLERFRPGDPAEARAQLDLPRERPVVTYFGFIYPSKGFRDFIRAASLLRDRGIEATYLIVGGAVRGAEFFRTRVGRSLQLLDLARDYEREAKQLVSESALEDSVWFMPFTGRTELVYQASDVVVAPSRGPELGRPVIEASACGRAIVASGSLSGAGILLPDVTGYLVPRRSPDILSGALAHLLGDPDLRARLGTSARNHAEKHFSAATNATRVMQIYSHVLSAGA